MTLGNMRSVDITRIDATCRAIGCGHEAIVDVGGWPDEVPVPDVGLRLRCSAGGAKLVETRPDWGEFRPARGVCHVG
jgi:hypothetical protein